MTMETLRLVLTIAGLVLVLLTSIITFIAKNSKNKKVAKAATNLLAVIGATRQFVTEAESLLNFSGENKKEWVMTKVNQFCISKGIVYDEKKVDEILEDYITFSKEVNVGSKEEQL